MKCYSMAFDCPACGKPNKVEPLSAAHVPAILSCTECNANLLRSYCTRTSQWAIIRPPSPVVSLVYFQQIIDTVLEEGNW